MLDETLDLFFSRQLSLSSQERKFTIFLDTRCILMMYMMHVILKSNQHGCNQHLFFFTVMADFNIQV